MQIKIKKRIGKSLLEFQINEAKDIDALFTAGILASIPDKCGICQSEDVCLKGNRAKGYVFVKVFCNKCFAQAGYGQYKEGIGGFWKNWEKFEKKEPIVEKDNITASPSTDDDINLENIPF